ncbi:hypothetical protein [Paenibacillus harenae]|uniref:hypothetical protein n=1 Tax=Paenibacillus harenae TaxID=306543 RepID=UPI00278D595F|nr:hypothetical protein [Paenibacillus harenae]MDQ0059990.1 Ca2+/Na+ antiporter [Paenibacillus harenae]
MELLQQLIPWLGITSLPVTIVAIFKIIAMLKTSKIERLILNDQKNLMIQAIQIFSYSLFLSIFVIYIHLLIDSEQPIEYYVALFIILVIAWFIFISFAMPTFETFRKTSYHYIEIKNEEKTERFYIHKVTISNLILLCNTKNLNEKGNKKIFVEVDFIKEKVLFLEYD